MRPAPDCSVISIEIAVDPAADGNILFSKVTGGTHQYSLEVAVEQVVAQVLYLDGNPGVRIQWINVIAVAQTVMIDQFCHAVGICVGSLCASFQTGIDMFVGIYLSCRSIRSAENSVMIPIESVIGKSDILVFGRPGVRGGRSSVVDREDYLELPGLVKIGRAHV